MSIKTVIVTWREDQRDIALAALKVAGVEFIAYETPIEYEDLNDALRQTCKADLVVSDESFRVTSDMDDVF